MQGAVGLTLGRLACRQGTKQTHGRSATAHMYVIPGLPLGPCDPLGVHVACDGLVTGSPVLELLIVGCCHLLRSTGQCSRLKPIRRSWVGALPCGSQQGWGRALHTGCLQSLLQILQALLRLYAQLLQQDNQQPSVQYSTCH